MITGTGVEVVTIVGPTKNPIPGGPTTAAWLVSPKNDCCVLDDELKRIEPSRR